MISGVPRQRALVAAAAQTRRWNGRSGQEEFDVERLVSIVEKSIAEGHKVQEVQITTLIEMLMRQAVKLDNISAEGEAASSKNSQEKRLQTCVETLDVLKVSNAKINPVVVTTTWETFDISPARPSNPRI